MLVKDLIKSLATCDQEAEVVGWFNEDGDTVNGVSTNHPSEFYWQGDCPIDKDTKAVTLL